jgi:hypothetical protein
MSGVRQARCWPPSTAIIWPVTSSASTSQRTAAQRHRPGLGGEVPGGLVHRRQGRSRPHAVDPDARRQGLGHGPGGEPQRRLGQAVGKESRIGLQHPLVEDVDDGRAVRRLPREYLGQQHRRPQVGVDMVVPALAGDGVQPVVGEHRGVVDQNRQRPQRPGRAADQVMDGDHVGQIGGQGDGAPAQGLDLAGHAGGLVPGVAVVDGHVETRRRQFETDRPTDPPRPAGDQGAAATRRNLSQPDRTRPS